MDIVNRSGDNRLLSFQTILTFEIGPALCDLTESGSELFAWSLADEIKKTTTQAAADQQQKVVRVQ